MDSSSPIGSPLGPRVGQIILHQLGRLDNTGEIRGETPFSHKTLSGTFKGFSVDLLEEIRAAAQRSVGRGVRLELLEITPADRLRRVAAGEIDIVCGITTPTWNRRDLVDFLCRSSAAGPASMVYRGPAGHIADVGRLEIGVVEGATTVAVVKDRLPAARLRIYANMAMRCAGSRRARSRAWPMSVSCCSGSPKRSTSRHSVALLLRTRPLATEALACVLLQNDSPWRDLVNRTLVDLFAGVEDFRDRYEEIYDRWFGRDGVLFYPFDRECARWSSRRSPRKGKFRDDGSVKATPPSNVPAVTLGVFILWLGWSASTAAHSSPSASSSTRW